MIVLTVNTGSTSVKLGAFQADGAAGEPGPPPRRLAAQHLTGAGLDPEASLREFLRQLDRAPAAVAHRVVHGGTRFTAPALHRRGGARRRSPGWRSSRPCTTRWPSVGSMRPARSAAPAWRTLPPSIRLSSPLSPRGRGICAAAGARGRAGHPPLRVPRAGARGDVAAVVRARAEASSLAGSSSPSSSAAAAPWRPSRGAGRATPRWGSRRSRASSWRPGRGTWMPRSCPTSSGGSG